ncbi:(2Fe-2S)-binding protein [Pseudonocardia nematodicida]|uniref:(2Fe-2S)-binding protein n=1 Tax=Pseudonocardia nematodicida TaxID=1206997 RepID=A0ABV1KDF2_9PSEU
MIDDVLVPLVEEIRSRFSVPGIVLWGNVASSIAGAKRVLDIQRPDLAERVAAVASDLLAHPKLVTAGESGDAVPPDRVWTYRRRSCCLYYRLPGGSVCADCVLQRD